MPGHIHPTAQIGNPPEHRDWIKDRSAHSHYPQIAFTATINAFVTVDSGLNEPTRIGPRTFVMAHCHVGHDAQIGTDCELAPGTVIGGHAAILDHVRIGMNACIKPFVTVGAGARIGMGSVVIRDVPAGETWAGNPARKLA